MKTGIERSFAFDLLEVESPSYLINWNDCVCACTFALVRGTWMVGAMPSESPVDDSAWCLAYDMTELN